jgi:hypothetical protein
MGDTPYRRRCDSVVHQAEGEWLEDDTQKEGAQEPITDKCLDWHPDLVWYEKFEIDYEALATRIQEDDDMAGHIIVSHSEYVKLARSYAETLGVGGDHG